MFLIRKYNAIQNILFQKGRLYWWNLTKIDIFSWRSDAIFIMERCLSYRLVQSVPTVDKSEPMIIKLNVIQSKTMHQPQILRHLQLGSISDDFWVLLSIYMSSNIITMVIIICLWPFFIQYRNTVPIYWRRNGTK